jgi:hypothetical protein
MATTQPNTDQNKIVFRLKLQNFSVLLKKLANILLHAETESPSPTEPQIIHRFLGLAGQLESLESLEKADGEIFASSLINLISIVQSLGTVSGGHTEYYEDERLAKVLKTLKDIEDQCKEFLPLVVAIDEERKESNHETFGGLLQKLTDVLQEKRYFLMRRGEKA